MQNHAQQETNPTNLSLIWATVASRGILNVDSSQSPTQDFAPAILQCASLFQCKKVLASQPSIPRQRLNLHLEDTRIGRESFSVLTNPARSFVRFKSCSPVVSHSMDPHCSQECTLIRSIPATSGEGFSSSLLIDPSIFPQTLRR